MRAEHSPSPALVLLASLCLTLAAALPASAATIVINNVDGPNEGFNDPTPVSPVGGNDGTTLGQQRLNVFQRAADIWGATIESDVTIVVQASFDPLSCSAFSGVLGAAGAIHIVRDFPSAPFGGTWYHVALANAISGEDLVPGSDDIRAIFNSSIDNNNSCLFGINWYLGFDHQSGNDIDLLVVLLHEFAHGLGFSSFTDEETGAFIQGLPDIYSLFTFDNTLGKHWNEMTTGERSASAVNDGNVVWDGPNVTGGSGFLTAGFDAAGNVKLYAPDPVQPGSSISHWDTTATPNLLMEPFINDGLGSDLDLTDEQMFDVGWSSASAPVCGNGIAEIGEECDGADIGDAACSDTGCASGTPTCAADCTLDYTTCGDCDVSCDFDGVCETGEDCLTCASDCVSGISSGAVCGNGVCEAGNGEDCLSCPQDCNGSQRGRPSDRFCCGDGDGTNPLSCSDPMCTSGGVTCTDSPVAGESYCCGDAACGGDETSLNCELDCGSTCTETSEVSCSDGIDNDCDGLFDADDPDCQLSDCSGNERGPNKCSDGIDNDCDGLTDAADPSCN